MRVTEIYHGKFLQATELPDGDIPVEMSHYEMVDFGSEEKAVLYFKGKKRGLILNKTNAYKISELHGDDMEEWPGKRVVMYKTSTEFQGRSVPCIRFRDKVPSPKKAKRPPAPEPQEFDDDGMPAGDDIPF